MPGNRWANHTRTLENQQTRFLKYVDKISSPKGCWLWIGARDKNGYGIIFIRMPNGHLEKKAHRISYIWWKGPIPEDKPYLLHKRTCNDTSCVNYTHLYPGTLQDNIADKVALGTHLRVARGEAHYRSRNKS